MRQTDYRKKGFTLVELSIVVALIGIAATLIITFTGFMGKRVGDVTSEKTIKEELNDAETMIGSFVRHFDNIYYKINPNDGECGGLVVNYVGKGGGEGTEYAKLYFDTDTNSFVWEETNKETQKVKCKSIIGFTYSKSNASTNGNNLLAYFIKYKESGSDEVLTHVVLITVRTQDNASRSVLK